MQMRSGYTIADSAHESRHFEIEDDEQEQMLGVTNLHKALALINRYVDMPCRQSALHSLSLGHVEDHSGQTPIA